MHGAGGHFCVIGCLDVENNNLQVQTAEIDILLSYPLGISRSLISSALAAV